MAQNTRSPSYEPITTCLPLIVIWMKFGKTSTDNYENNQNYYLTTWNNVAMIQTGHSNGAATTDEQKVLANTLFYLAQLTTDTQTKDRSGMDVATPDSIQEIFYNQKSNTVSFSTPKDNGTVYEYYVEAIGQNSGEKKQSQKMSITNTSGMKGYSIVVDNNPSTMPDDNIETTVPRYKLAFSPEQGMYIHVAAVDQANNKAVVHFKVEKPEILIQPNLNTWTNGEVTLTVTGKGFGLTKLALPDKSVMSGTQLNYTVKENGSYTFYGLNEGGEILAVGSFVVSNIDRNGKTILIVPGDGKWRNQDIEVQISIID